MGALFSGCGGCKHTFCGGWGKQGSCCAEREQMLALFKYKLVGFGPNCLIMNPFRPIRTDFADCELTCCSEAAPVHTICMWLVSR